MSHARQALGASGEDLAAAWYRKNGFVVIDRNWRCRDGEIDVVASQAGLVVFAEVKTRSSVAFGHPFEVVTSRQRVRVRRAAAAWIATQRTRPQRVRFDVVAVMAGVVDVVTDAF